MQNKPTDYFHCVKIIDNNSAVWKSITTHHTNVVIDGVTYIPGNIIKIDNPKISTSVDREIFKVAFSDPSFADGSVVETSLVGYKMEVRLCFLDYQTKAVLTTITDTLLVYAGRVEGATYVIRTEEQGEVALQITCSSPMGDLDMKRSMYLSKDFIRGRNPTDSSCDTIYGGSGILTLKWGKR